MPPSSAPELVGPSRELIKRHQAPSGAYPACPTFPHYAYCWFRDGAFIADAMSRWGELESAEAFFGWCASTVERHAGDPYLHARYTLDGEPTPEAWWPTFQLDGIGTWLWALREHERRHARELRELQPGAELALAYAASRWSEPCHDWWEEREGIHAATLACLHAGLAAFARPEAEAVRAALPALGEARLDGSLLVLAPLGLADAADLVRLVRPLVAGGGVHRHLEDTYYGGGQWLLLTAMLGWVEALAGDEAAARSRLEWVAAHATDDGGLPEQSRDHLLHPDEYEPWLRKWGRPACPLLWSHAMFLTLADVLR